MAHIISIDEKIKLAKTEKDRLIRKRKIQAVQKVFQCTHCAFKCEKCGTQIEQGPSEASPTHNLRVPYRFCEGCSEEYLDYIERLKGGGDSDSYWHNNAWMALWKAWIDYQSSMDQYLKSKEFRTLMDELKQSRSEP